MGVDPGEVPPLPVEIEEILAKPSPFWEDQPVADTDMLVLIPKAVTKMIDGVPVVVPLTLKTLIDLLKESSTIKLDCWYKILEVFGDTPIEKSHWVLMTKDVLPESRNKLYLEQKFWVEHRLVEQNLQPSGYEVPSFLEAATAIILGNMCLKTNIFGNNPLTYTRCQETTEIDNSWTSLYQRSPNKNPPIIDIVSIGAFVPDCFVLQIIGQRDEECPDLGMAALKKL